MFLTRATTVPSNLATSNESSNELSNYDQMKDLEKALPSIKNLLSPLPKNIKDIAVMVLTSAIATANMERLNTNVDECIQELRMESNGTHNSKSAAASALKSWATKQFVFKQFAVAPVQKPEISEVLIVREPNPNQPKLEDPVPAPQTLDEPTFTSVEIPIPEVEEIQEEDSQQEPKLDEDELSLADKRSIESERIQRGIDQIRHFDVSSESPFLPVDYFERVVAVSESVKGAIVEVPDKVKTNLNTEGGSLIKESKVEVKDVDCDAKVEQYRRDTVVDEVAHPDLIENKMKRSFTIIMNKFSHTVKKAFKKASVPEQAIISQSKSLKKSKTAPIGVNKLARSSRSSHIVELYKAVQPTLSSKSVKSPKLIRIAKSHEKPVPISTKPLTPKTQITIKGSPTKYQAKSQPESIHLAKSPSVAPSESPYASDEESFGSVEQDGYFSMTVQASESQLDTATIDEEEIPLTPLLSSPQDRQAPDDVSSDWDPNSADHFDEILKDIYEQSEAYRQYFTKQEKTTAVKKKVPAQALNLWSFEDLWTGKAKTTEKVSSLKNSKTEGYIGSDQGAVPYVCVGKKLPEQSSSRSRSPKVNQKRQTIVVDDVVAYKKSVSVRANLNYDMEWQNKFHEEQKDNISKTLKSVSWGFCNMIRRNHQLGRFHCDPQFDESKLEVSEVYDHLPEEEATTDWKDIYDQLVYIFDCGELTSEHAVIIYIYVKRMLELSGQHLFDHSWRLIVMSGLLTAVKIWDDCAIYNSDFGLIFPDMPLEMINNVERVFLKHLQWNVSVPCSEFAKTYFNLREIEHVLLTSDIL